MIPFSFISFYGIVLIGAMILLMLSGPENERTPIKETVSFIAAVLIMFEICCYIDSRHSMSISVPVLLICLYLIYIYSFQEPDLLKKSFIFCLTASLLSFEACIFISLHLILHSDGQAGSGLLHIVPMYVYCVFIMICIYRRRNSAVHLIRACNNQSFWNSAWLVPFIIAIINIYMTVAVESVPAKHLNPYKSIAAEVILFILLCLYLENSYRQATDKVKLGMAKNETELLQMEAEYYKNNLSYIQESSRIRHDFRQIMITMQTLLAEQKYDELSTFMDQYFKDNPLPASAVRYSHSNPLNAVLNHYQKNAENSHIKLNWKISIPESLQIGETDLCIVFGNLLSNALNGCLTVPEDKRYISLRAEEDDQGHFYITQVNSYDGNTRMKNSRYLSTTNGSGIGLGSIELTAGKYSGMAEFKAGKTEFTSSVMMVDPAPLADSKN